MIMSAYSLTVLACLSLVILTRLPLNCEYTSSRQQLPDTTFMIGFLATGLGVGKDDVDKYLAALRRAQMELDLHLERYRHYHLRAVPEKYRDQVDVRAFGMGERIVFLPYTREVFDATQQWTQVHEIFPQLPGSALGYDEAALV